VEGDWHDLRIYESSTPMPDGYAGATMTTPEGPLDREEASAQRIEVAPGVMMPKGALVYSASRSSGPGGQNVNKVNSRVELRIALEAIPIPTAARARLGRMAGRRLNAAGELLIAADDHRSQRQNKAEAMARLRDLIVRALVKPKPRITTKPTKGSARRRIEAKKQRGEIKKNRGGRPGRPDELD